MKMTIKYDYSNFMSNAIGSEGISDKILNGYEKLSLKYRDEFKDEFESGKIKFPGLPFEKKYAKEAYDFANKRMDKFENFVVLGIGGSALGNTALLTALGHPYHNLVSKKLRRGPRIFVLDNIDPDQFCGFLDLIDAKKTLFNVISKSGETAETMSQFLIIYELLKKKLGKKFRNNIVVTTDTQKGFLRKIVDKEGYDSFVVPDGIGGRFTILTPVGLLSSAFAGIDITSLLKGAGSVAEMFMGSAFKENPILINTALHYHFDMEMKKNISVMMPYSYKLKDFADWYRQLWAESLGKKCGLDGKEIFTGPTPVKALGVTDQHSQVQLYTEGPNNKVFTFLTVENWNKRVKIPKLFKEIDGLSYLGNHTLNELMTYERIGTELALKSASRPLCQIIFPKVDAFTVGQFIMFYEIQTALAGKFYKINPYDQPGVEAGKKVAYALMGRKGYEEYRKEILNLMSNKESDFVI